MIKSASLAAFAALLMAPVAANAAIVMGNITGGSVATANPAGSFVQLTGTGFTVNNNNFDVNDLFGFDEVQNSALTAPLLLSNGTTLAAGTVISSHYILFDPLRQGTVTATLAFDAPILGLLLTDAALTASNSLGRAGVTYLTTSGYGLDLGTDVAPTIGGSPNQLVVNQIIAATPGDAFRVITAGTAVGVVPEPATWLTMMLGFGLIGGAVRLRRQNRAAHAA